MRKDQIFVLMLVVLLPLTGCFDGGGVGEAEGAQDSTSTPTVVNNYYNNTTATSSSQERTWYSSGGLYNTYWNDGQEYSSGSQRCIDYGPTYDSSTGEYLGEDCREFGYPEVESDWNTTNCTSNGGQMVAHSSGNWRNAPYCKIIFETITTSPGEALLIYQISGASSISDCGGVGATIQTTYLQSGKEYVIVPGSALDCVHEISTQTGYIQSTSYYADYLTRQSLWSTVYAIQETTVV
jgi:hypothetical protein